MLPSPPPLLLRADASHAVGIGHLMRCLSVAMAQRADGGEVFLAGRMDAAVADKARAAGVVLLPWPREELAPGDDASRLLEAMGAMEREPVVLLDGYGFSESMLAALAAQRVATALFDDYRHLAFYDVAALINPNPGADSLDYATPARTRLLLGTAYAPLRQEFVLAAKTPRQDLPGPARRLLVTAGGSDPEGLTLAVARALAGLAPATRVRFVLGPAYRDHDRLKSLVAGVPWEMELLCDVRDMAAQMAWAQLVITAGGSTCHELACMGTPFLVCPVAENQHRLAAGYARQGAAVLLHPGMPDFERTLGDAVTSLIADQDRRRAMARAGQRMVDGNGARRIVEALRAMAQQTTRGDYRV